MAEYNISQARTTDMSSGVTDYSVDNDSLDSPADQKETSYNNPNWAEYLGYYKTIPELKQAIDALARWTAGKGYKTDLRTKVRLSHIKGWGEDSFQSILQNMMVVKKINGDAFAEIIRDNQANLINLKPLNPAHIKIIVDRKGLIIRYEQTDRYNQKTVKKFKPSEILHLCNDRIGDEIHGVSIIESCKTVINARNEAMSDWRLMLHRNLIGVRIIEVDEDNTTKLNALKKTWKDAIENGEVLILPKGSASFPPANTQNPENWIRYLENFFYQAVGVPKVILGGAAEYTEASSKVGYLTFEQVYMAEQRLLEDDILNQLGLEVTFERPVSLKESMIESEAANTGQVGFQPNEVNTTMRRTE